MVKPKDIIFTEALESVLVSIWGGTKPHLDNNLIKKTRNALVDIREIYQFKGNYTKKYPSTINFRYPKNRAGYLAAFGQRHAYLPYFHLKRIAYENAKAIPKPESNKGELIVTVLGAGAAMELYGLVRYFNEESTRLKKLNLILVDKIDDWKPNRHTVFDKLMKGTFPKLNIIPHDIDADLTKDCIRAFSDYYQILVKTDVLLIYNVMNEIITKHSNMVWQNINYILKNAEKQLLVMLAEPAAHNATPRISWLKTQLAQRSTMILNVEQEEFNFNNDPFLVAFEETGSGLNDKLFAHYIDGKKPELKSSIKRTHFACMVEPNSPISFEQVNKQLAVLNLKRVQRGLFAKRLKEEKTFWDSFPNWDK